MAPRQNCLCSLRLVQLGVDEKVKNTRRKVEITKSFMVDGAKSFEALVYSNALCFRENKTPLSKTQWPVSRVQP
ncbi:hypothetical protein OUZ56_009277 [Daphnia magna]|uniref:Uncharacterized protein n=1 Tax=Daphnia magna TaxID=35525 RepID=A0ABR0AFI4_9CRUS|nr:hypothetical protein OUZ56_009277 [Daphnia magna]